MSDSGKEPLTLKEILESLENFKLHELRMLEKAISALIQHQVDMFGKPPLCELLAGLEWDDKDNPPISAQRIQEIKNGARPTEAEIVFVSEALEMDSEELVRLLRWH